MPSVTQDLCTCVQDTDEISHCINTVSQLRNMNIQYICLHSGVQAIWGPMPQFLHHFHVTLAITVLKHSVLHLTNSPQLTLHFSIGEGLTNYVRA